MGARYSFVKLARLMRRHQPAPTKEAMVRAVACDRVWSDHGPPSYTAGETPSLALRRALRRCAVGGYRRLARSARHRHARLAAARLAYLLDYDGDANDGQQQRLRREILRLRKRFGGTLPLIDRAPTEAMLEASASLRTRRR